MDQATQLMDALLGRIDDFSQIQYDNYVKVRSTLNPPGTTPEVNDLPSLTVPNMALSIRQILDRYARGLPLGGQRLPVYDEDNDLPDIRTLDLVDRAELADHYRAELEAIAERHNALTSSPPITPPPAPQTTPPAEP